MVRCCLYSKILSESLVPGKCTHQALAILADSLFIIQVERCRVCFLDLLQLLPCYKWFLLHFYILRTKIYI